MNDELYHVGTPHEGSTPHSGRYAWGSGDAPYQRDTITFLAFVNQLKKEQKMSDVEIARLLGISTTVLRARRSIGKDELRASRSREALRLKDKGYSNEKIGEILGSPGNPLPESTVRNLLNPALSQRANVTSEIADTLKSAVKEHKYVQVGKGVDAMLGVSSTRLRTAIEMLEAEGYEQKNIYIEQLGTGYKTTIKLLVPEGTPIKEIYDNKEKIALPTGQVFVDNEYTKLNLLPPLSVDPKRVAVRYAEDGGTQMDGVIQVRRGVEDLSMGEARYAQVRIKVGDGHYLKGMAMYADDLPDGVDLMFNTNKHKGTPMLGKKDNTVLKNLKDDPDNPFGATVYQKIARDADGKEYLTSAMNIVNEEGKWGEWSKSISSQVLSKQPVPLVKKQLNLAYQEKKQEYDEIMALTNPAVKKELLESFADDCDASAVHLKAAAMPRQQSHVILPFPNMKEDEIYAPNYEDGETVVLIRYPHAGRFEIPTLRVNNKNKEAQSLIPNAIDAVGIHPKVAERLSGADFDGDTVLVIPNNTGAIKTKPALKQLENFNPSEYYPAYEGMPRVGPETGFHKQSEMGKVSNLITDMTIMGATDDEIARAVKHSMVVIDAEKHNLNWRASYEDNGIAQLKEKYLGGADRGASTLVSRAKSPARVPQRKLRTSIDPETGEKIYYETGDTYIDKKGRVQDYTTVSSRMAEAKDAYELVSGNGRGTPVENAYADYANKLKALGNEARKSYLDTPPQKYSPSAKETYKTEVDHLKAQLANALRNAPLEKQAQIYANVTVAQKRRDNPDMDRDSVKRLKSQALAAARARTGASRYKITISPKEWEAIQAGAVSNNTLMALLKHTDLDIIRSYATPRSDRGLTQSQINRMKALIASGATQAEVADKFGVSVSTVVNAIKS